MAEEILNNGTQDKLVRVSFIKGILEKLYNWLPFRKTSNGGIVQITLDGTTTNETTNEGEIALGKYNLSDYETVLSLGIGDNGQRKNAIKISNKGEIFIITDFNTNNVESLQQAIADKGVTFCDSYDEMLIYLNSGKFLGKFLYLKNDSTFEGTNYSAGLYLICIDASNHGAHSLFNVGSSITKMLESYYTKDEVNVLIDKVNAGDIDLTNYYTIAEINTKFEEIEDRIEVIEDWKEEPITSNELQDIISK